MTETVKSPFVFEFLGLDAKDVVEESELESALMDHLQEFMLELGNGFCFEARQKRIMVDEEYYYRDMVFYNRMARFGVVLELKSHKLRGVLCSDDLSDYRSPCPTRQSALQDV